MKRDLSEKVPTARSFRRVEMPVPHFRYSEDILNGGPQPVGRKEGREDHDVAISDLCIACNERHRTGYCPLKLAGVEFCGLCNLAHYGSGSSRNCPHLDSVTQCQAMLEALKSSPEPQEHLENSRRYVVGVIARLKQKKKQKKANGLQSSDSTLQPFGPSSRNQALGPPDSTLQPSGPSFRNQALGPPDMVTKGPYASPYAHDVSMMNENRIAATGTPIFTSMNN